MQSRFLSHRFPMWELGHSHVYNPVAEFEPVDWWVRVFVDVVIFEWRMWLISVYKRN